MQIVLDIPSYEKGDILYNRMATIYNPFVLFVYQGESDGVVSGLGLYDNNLISMRCFAKASNGLSVLAIVGHSKREENYKKDLKELGM